MSQERFTNKLSAVSIADLLQLRGKWGPLGLDAETAALFGYARVPRPQEDAPALVEPPFDRSQQFTPALEDTLEIPTEVPHFPFLVATEATTLKVDPPEHLSGNPISDRELLAPKDRPGLPLRPLIRWSKLARYLKSRLGSLTEGSRLNTRQMIRLACAGHPLAKLPRTKRLAWNPQVTILWDDSPEMAPFAADAVWLCRQLKDERGHSGFNVIELKGPPRLHHLAQISVGAPIIAMSAMGQLEANAAVQSAWLRFAKRLQHRGDKGYVLNPCPRGRWDSRLARAWSITLWDRGNRLSRPSEMTEIPLSTSQDDLVETLLTWLVPARRINSSLLREIRLGMGSSANAGTEWDAWKHPANQQGPSSFCVRPGADYEERLKHREVLVCKQPRLAKQIDRAIRLSHEAYSPVIAAETDLRLVLSGLPSPLEAVRDILSRVVDRLRRVARKPLDQEGVESGLPKWFPQMIERLSEEMRRDDSVGVLIAQGLALCHIFQKADGGIPPGVDRDAYARESREASLRIDEAESPVDYIVGLQGRHVSLVPAGSETKLIKPLGRMTVGGAHRVQVNIIESSTQSSLQLDGGSHLGVPYRDLTLHCDTAPSLRAALQLQSSHGTLDFRVIQRPAWAERFWYDRFGIAAEFSVRGVPFVLRWIPPGQFLMGSPDSEAGRYDDEGPQHSVTISHGFWLGETPVTQEQWEAVVLAASERKLSVDYDIKPKPSHFQGTPNLPVEQVTWHDSTRFCRLLNDLVAEWRTADFLFQLPTEAQWEYACRAGIQSAFYDGSDCTRPEGLDPALDQLGWFVSNSEQKTHAVKGKRRNPWGLYDMLGNVWEWCADAWVERVYQSRSAGVVDPFKDDSDNARRVLRGGSWGDRAQSCRAAYRRGTLAGFGWAYFGLRLAAGQEPVT